MESNFNEFNFNNQLGPKDFSTSSLCKKVKSFTSSVPGWITDLLTDQTAEPATCTVLEAMTELNLRRETNRSVNKIKELVTGFTTDKVLTIGPDGYKAKGLKSEVGLTIVGGHIVIGDSPDTVAPTVTTSIARDNVVEAVVFPITSASKKEHLEVVLAEKAAKIGMEMYPVSRVFGATRSREYVVDTLKAKLVADPKALNTIVSPFSTAMKWQGVSFSCPIDVPTPKKINTTGMYTVMSEQRDVRGSDVGIRSEGSRGYYWGYMPTSLYRAAYVVSDLMALGSKAGINCLEIQRVDGLFSTIVLQSLVANGWKIRVVQGFELKSTMEEAELVTPGIYNKVKFVTCFVYEALDDKIPSVEKGISYTDSILSHLRSIPENKGRYAFTYCYLRDEMQNISRKLYPTAHAHSGQVIYCQLEQKVGLDFVTYINRVIRANVVKTFHVYTRTVFYFEDPFRSDIPFRLSQKTVKDINKVEMDIAREYITVWAYKGDYVVLAPQQAADLQIAHKDKKEMSREETAVYELMKENNVVPEVEITISNPVVEVHDGQDLELL